MVDKTATNQPQARIGLEHKYVEPGDTIESLTTAARLNADWHIASNSWNNRLTAALQKAQDETVPGTSQRRQAEMKAIAPFADEFLYEQYFNRITHELAKRGYAQELDQFIEAQAELYKFTHNGESGGYNAPRIREMLAVTYHLDKQYDQALAIADEVLGNDSRPHVAAWRTKAMALRDRSHSHEDQMESHQAFEEGFAKTGDYSLGMGAMHGAMEAGDAALALQYAELVKLATLNVGGDETKIFWASLGYAESSLMTGAQDDIAKAMLHMEALLEPQKGIKSHQVTVAQKLSALERMERVSAQMPQLRTALKPLHDRLAMSLGQMDYAALPAAYEARFDPVERLARKQSYNHRDAGLENGFERGGNTGVNGMLSKSATSPIDKALYAEIANTPLREFIASGVLKSKDMPWGVSVSQPLAAIRNDESRIRVQQAMSRGFFHVDQRSMEHLHSLEHKTYDAGVRAHLFIAGIYDKSHLTQTETNIYQAIKESQLEDKDGRTLYANLHQRRPPSGHQSNELAGIFARFVLREETAPDPHQLIAKAELFRRSDTSTNTSVCLSKGDGDCRHINDAETQLGEAVQQARVKQSIMLAAQGIVEKDAGKFRKNLREADDELTRYETRVADHVVMAAVEVPKMYKPVLTRDGRFVASQDNKISAIEGHTTANTFIKGSDGSVVHAITDAFYQGKKQGRDQKEGPYKLGWVVPKQKAKIVENSRGEQVLEMVAGEIQAVICERDDEGKIKLDGEGYPIPVRSMKPVKTELILQSSGYSRNQDKVPSSQPMLRYGGADLAAIPDIVKELTDPQRTLKALAFDKLALKLVAKLKGSVELNTQDLLTQAQDRVNGEHQKELDRLNSQTPLVSEEDDLFQNMRERLARLHDTGQVLKGRMGDSSNPKNAIRIVGTRDELNALSRELGTIGIAVQPTPSASLGVSINLLDDNFTRVEELLPVPFDQLPGKPPAAKKMAGHAGEITAQRLQSPGWSPNF
jgi:hypothetical protein